MSVCDIFMWVHRLVAKDEKKLPSPESVAKLVKELILRGRKLNGEPADFDF